VINKRAEDRLKEDLFKLSESIWSSRLFSKSDAPKMYFKKEGKESFKATREGTNMQPETVYPRDAFSCDSNTMNAWKDGYNRILLGEFMKIMFDFWIETYIKEETESFIQKINDIESEMEYLKDNIV